MASGIPSDYHFFYLIQICLYIAAEQLDRGPAGAADGSAAGEPAAKVATIDMTLTSAACPLTDMIEDETAQALDGHVERFRINWVWMPPWGPERITDDGRDMMRALGFSI